MKRCANPANNRICQSRGRVDRNGRLNSAARPDVTVSMLDLIKAAPLSQPVASSQNCSFTFHARRQPSRPIFPRGGACEISRSALSWPHVSPCFTGGERRLFLCFFFFFFLTLLANSRRSTFARFRDFAFITG
jgi:hypothetical protein